MKENDGRNPRDRESSPWFLIVKLGIRLLVLPRIGHGHSRAIEQINPTTFPQPLGVDLVIQRSPHQAGNGGEECFWQPLSGLAICPRFRTAGFQSLRTHDEQSSEPLPHDRTDQH
ncbi:MAG: hypothetical protein JWN70_5396 [Planctomycetaceae bacterium]|nr:hypothetical protein [Planctomycetaceae bacterium]